MSPTRHASCLSICLSTAVVLAVMFGGMPRADGASGPEPSAAGIRAALGRFKQGVARQWDRLPPKVRATTGVLSAAGGIIGSIVVGKYQPELAWPARLVIGGSVSLLSYCGGKLFARDFARAFPATYRGLSETRVGSQITLRGRRLALKGEFAQLRQQAAELAERVAQVPNRTTGFAAAASDTLSGLQRELFKTQGRDGQERSSYNLHYLARAIGQGDISSARRGFVRVRDKMAYVEYLLHLDDPQQAVPAPAPAAARGKVSRLLDKAPLYGPHRIRVRAEREGARREELLTRIDRLTEERDALAQRIEAELSAGKRPYYREALNAYIPATGASGLAPGSRLHFAVGRGDLSTATEILDTIAENVARMNRDISDNAQIYWGRYKHVR